MCVHFLLSLHHFMYANTRVTFFSPFFLFFFYAFALCVCVSHSTQLQMTQKMHFRFRCGLCLNNFSHVSHNEKFLHCSHIPFAFFFFHLLSWLQSVTRRRKTFQWCKAFTSVTKLKNAKECKRKISWFFFEIKISQEFFFINFIRNIEKELNIFCFVEVKV